MAKLVVILVNNTSCVDSAIFNQGTIVHASLQQSTHILQTILCPSQHARHEQSFVCIITMHAIASLLESCAI